MAYASWSVVFGEQPSASKWNILGTNDSYFNTQVGSNFSLGTTSTVWWEELGRTTLGSSGDTITLSSLAARKYLLVIFSLINSGSIDGLLTFNNDSANNYAIRLSTNGVADTTSTSRANWSLVPTTGSFLIFGTINILNISTSEKIGIINTMGANTAGAGNAPERRESVGKWANTSSQISRIDINNSSGGSFDTGSQIIVLGHD